MARTRGASLDRSGAPIISPPQPAALRRAPAIGESPIDSTVRDRPVMKRVASTYRGDIDGLRALAVGLVVLFHASPNCLPGGFIGVDIFFVISGYLITGIILPRLEQQQFSYLEFFGRRIRRIGPALVVVLLASVAMGSSVSSYPDLRTLGLQVSAASAFSANLLFWSQSGYFAGVAESKPLLHLWSLGVEEQFYLVWPALMASAAVLLARWWVVVLSIVILSFIANVALIDIYPDATFYLLPGRLWELGLGGSLAWYRRSRPFTSDPLRANIEAWLGLGLIVFSAIFFSEYVSFPGWWAACPTVGAMLVIDAGPEAWANRQVLSRAPFRAVGLISYPIYLWHWPLLVFVPMTRFSGPMPKITAVALTLVLSYLTYRYVEVPIRFGRFTAQKYTSLAVPTILAGMVLAAGVGQLAPVWRRHAQHLPDWATEDYRTDATVAYREGRCFLRPTQTATEFKPDCYGGGSSTLGASRPLIMLWGDSHAAHLYPGVLVQQQRVDRKFRLAQFTASSCPPIFGISIDLNRNCKDVVNTLERTIRQLRPDIVIMAAHWVDPPFTAITETVRRLHAMGVAHVVVVGPMPSWDLPLPVALLRENSPTAGPPEYLRKHLRSHEFEMDVAMRSTTLAGGGQYVSALGVLCNGPRGCLATVAAPGGPTPTAWDDAHLTTAGSIAFIERIWDRQIVPDLSATRSPPGESRATGTR